MKISIIGGGPGGLYTAVLLKKQWPHYHITVYERNRPDDTFGFGVVFSDETLGIFKEYVPQVAARSGSWCKKITGISHRTATKRCATTLVAMSGIDHPSVQKWIKTIRRHQMLINSYARFRFLNSMVL